MNCDFCNAEIKRGRLYGCPGFTVAMAGGAVTFLPGPWGACTACAALIDRGDRHALLKRVAALYAEPLYEPRLMRRYLERTYDHFFRLKTEVA